MRVIEGDDDDDIDADNGNDNKAHGGTWWQMVKRGKRIEEKESDIQGIFTTKSH